jgi:haloalkane dehalogenase
MTKKTTDLSEDLSGCDFDSHYVQVHGSKLHYIKQGEGDPILFLHGIPTSCYLWRNIIPGLSDQAQCIALDLIGMGESDKPAIQYSIEDHIYYVEGFIQALGLRNITLVMHNWGSVIGFDYAMRKPENIKALVFYESHVKPVLTSDMLSLPFQMRAFALGNKEKNYNLIVQDNYFVEEFLPRAVLRKLTDREMAQYRKPFETIESRQVLWQYFLDFPLGSMQDNTFALMSRYSECLQRSLLPKLLLYSVPGFATPIEDVVWCRNHLPNLTAIDVGYALHFAQETVPLAFRQHLAAWYWDLAKDTVRC